GSCYRSLTQPTSGEPALRDKTVGGIEFDADEPTSLKLRGQQRRAGATKRIEHEIAGAREKHWINGVRTQSGFCVGCNLLPEYFHSSTSGIRCAGCDGLAKVTAEQF